MLECKFSFVLSSIYQLYLSFHRFVDCDMFMCFVGMGIGHQNGSTNTNISDSMDCDPDACEDSEDYGDDEIRQEVMSEEEDEEDIGNKGEEESEDEDKEDGEEDKDTDWCGEDDIGYDDL